MKKYLVIFSLIVLSFDGMAQQDALISQYMFNPFVFNPAYAGSRDAISSVLMVRKQWVGIKGAPLNQTISVHGPFKSKKVALGFNAINESIGPSQIVGTMGTYAYRIKALRGTISMALRGGGYFYKLRVDEIEFKDETDRFAQTASENKFVHNIDFGAYYYTNQLYIGLAGTHLTQGSLQDSANSYLSRHYNITSGYAFLITDNLVLKPSVNIKYVSKAPVNVDVNVSVLIQKIF